MNVGEAITEAMREQRMKDWWRIGMKSTAHHHLLYAYINWGWAIHGTSHLGKPGWDV